MPLMIPVTGNDSDFDAHALTVTDDHGAMGTATLDVVVDNVAPAVDAGPDQTVLPDRSVQFAGSFTDPGAADTHTFAWDFGDGTTASGTLAPTHHYTAPGVYTVTLTVTDDDGGQTTDSMTVTVLYWLWRRMRAAGDRIALVILSRLLKSE